MALHRESKLTTRLRLFIYTQDTQLETPILKERLLNHFAEFGDDMLRVSGIGEQAVALERPGDVAGSLRSWPAS